MAAPLTRLTRKEEHVFWNNVCEQSFQTLMEPLTVALVFSLLDGHDDLVVYSDALGIDLGCVLM